MTTASSSTNAKSESMNQLKDPNKIQVESLNEKLSMKLAALNAFKSNGYQQYDSKLVEVLKNDIEKLKHDISIYESHIQKTELWCENIGKWKTKVTGVRQPNASNLGIHSISLANVSHLASASSLSAPASTAIETAPMFEIHVELRDDEKILTGNATAATASKNARFREGWVIYRSYRQFETLNDTLIELISPELRAKFKRIPSSSLKRASKSLDEEKSRKITNLVDDYLRAICTDESLSQSEALYTFLCPSPDYFKRSNSQIIQNQSDEKFSIGSIFKM